MNSTKHKHLLAKATKLLALTVACLVTTATIQPNIQVQVAYLYEVTGPSDGLTRCFVPF